MLIAIALYFALKPNMDDVDRAERMTPVLFGLLIVPLVGFYDGVFGPGTGSFLMLAFVSLAGYGVLKATAHTKLINFATNLGGLAAFAAVGVVSWKVGLVMGVAQFLGARDRLGAGDQERRKADQAAARADMHRARRAASDRPGASAQKSCLAFERQLNKIVLIES